METIKAEEIAEKVAKVKLATAEWAQVNGYNNLSAPQHSEKAIEIGKLIDNWKNECNQTSLYKLAGLIKNHYGRGSHGKSLFPGNHRNRDF
jgi:hypothetical protein